MGKDGKSSKRGKIPKHIAGVKIPKDLRRKGDQIAEMLQNPIVAEGVAIGLATLANKVRDQSRKKNSAGPAPREAASQPEPPIAPTAPDAPDAPAAPEAAESPKPQSAPEAADAPRAPGQPGTMSSDFARGAMAIAELVAAKAIETALKHREEKASAPAKGATPVRDQPGDATGKTGG